MKLAKINFNNEEVEKIKNNYFNKNEKYLIKYNSVYLINYSENTGFSARVVYTNYEKMPLLAKGRHLITGAKFCNELIGRKIFIEEV